ncbi:type I-G CRISPR-associated protein, Cas3-extension family [Sorangium sp. So ce124]|uniref:type I-G CRISPR-associated protein, Cas3-extension family n=1 Tax=Sorangium sp. So ce124 TaxID=3133280 RepID=UPI003F62034F
MIELLLTGLDGKNPLAFLAALGVLNALADRAKNGIPEPRLVWRAGGTYRPAIVGGLDRGGLLDTLVQDLESFRGEAAIERLRYRKDGGGAKAHDLKPPPREFAKYLSDLVSDELVSDKLRRSLAFAAAFATDVAVDNKGNTKPTALHFTAGRQQFLGMVSELLRGVRAEDLEEALFGPWKYERPLPVFQWDNTSARDYALRASDPSKEKKLGVPGADWLAFRGLPFIRVAPVGDRIVTTGCSGEWKTGAFRWPIWTVPLSRSVIGSVLTSPEVFEVNPSVLRARGIAIVFEAAIRRSDQGGYGSFASARMARPARGS